MTRFTKSILRTIKHTSARVNGSYLKLSIGLRLLTVSTLFATIVLCAAFAVATIHGLIDIRLIYKKSSHLLFDRSYKFIASIENDQGEYGYWNMPDTLPATLRIATLAAEDRRFSDHSGVDLSSIFRAVMDNYIKHKTYSGASTIAQCKSLVYSVEAVGDGTIKFMTQLLHLE
jgi:membrane peptidoglycan carboxypeptidase